MPPFLPPDYDKSSDAHYPVLYLNHGGGEDDSLWTALPPKGGGQLRTSSTISSLRKKPDR